MSDELLSAEALLLARGYLYELFHKALGGYPTAEFVRELTGEATIDALDEYADSSEKVSDLRDFLVALSERASDDGALDQFVDAARDEYTRLFVGPGPVAAPPMETPHVSHEKVLFSENTVAVRRIYKSHGLTPVRELRIADDHVALMCDYLARLSGQALGAFRSGDGSLLGSLAADQVVFESSHMANWLPRLASLQSEAADAVLYPQLVAALAAFVDVDIQFLAELIAWIAEGPAWELDYDRPDAFASLEEALRRLTALRLFGLEDCELTEVPVATA